MVKVGRDLSGRLGSRRLPTSFSRIPRPLKRGLIPVWNLGHRIARSLGEYLGAVRHNRYGHCDVCDRFGPWLFRRRVVPLRLEQLWELSPKEAEALARKESLDCAFCGAKLRGRRLARVLLDTYPVGQPPAPASALAEWVKTNEARVLRVAEINRVDGLHKSLQNLPLLRFSDFRDPDAPELALPDIPSEDLARLSYPDNAFDLVVTSETLEHVPDLAAALAEIHRVLVPGGLHVFTIPMRPGVPRTFARSVIRPDGTIEHRAPVIRHPGGDTGYPVFTEFGADFPELFDRSGFETTMAYGPVRDEDLAQVFIARKRIQDG